MKSLLKPLMLGTALSTLGLCFTISHASNEQLLTAKNQNIASKHVYVYAFPLLESEGNHTQLIASNNIMNSSESLDGSYTSIGGLLNNPLLIIPNEVLPNHSPEKNNEHGFFEMTAMFNDKLQAFIASFQSSEEVDITDELANSSSVLTASCKS